MDPLLVLMVSALLVAPASGGNLLFKQVTTEQVDMTTTIPGPFPGTQFQLTIRGLVHSTSLIFTTDDPMTFRVVLLQVFHGYVSVSGTLPIIGPISIEEAEKVSFFRFVGTITFGGGGLPALDGLAAEKALGTITIHIGDVERTFDVNALILIKFTNGSVDWLKLVGPPASTA